MMRSIIGIAVCAVALSVASAQAADLPGYRVRTKAAKFEDVRDDVRDAIVNKGYVIDFSGHFNDMLERTAKDAGTGAPSPYKNAEYMTFCPAKLTHEAVHVSPFAIANCPITIFVFEAAAEPGKINVGYRLPTAVQSEAMRPVSDKFIALLDAIAAEATK
ncbi:MAG: DUF302 domain-containing protein [Proteobacteria bacterium]|nr:DUF302 domain-containing protein [Pseudomonadota bacterium]